jgi:hypothetical protein
MKKLEIGFSEDYEVSFTCEEIPQPPGMYHLQIVSKSVWRSRQQVENKKDFFLEKNQLMMICDYFNGVKNELNK